MTEPDQTSPRPPRRRSGTSGSENRQRRHTKLIRFDDQELATIEEAASRAGLTFSSYGRAQMLGEPVSRSVRRPPVEKELLAKLLGQLGRIGSNLNQVARAANQGESVGPEARAVLDEVRAAAHEVMHALGRPPHPRP